MHRNMESILSGCPNNMAPAIVPFYFEHDLSIRFVLILQCAAAIEISILSSHPNIGIRSPCRVRMDNSNATGSN